MAGDYGVAASVNTTVYKQSWCRIHVFIYSALLSRMTRQSRAHKAAKKIHGQKLYCANMRLAGDYTDPGCVWGHDPGQPQWLTEIGRKMPQGQALRPIFLLWGSWFRVGITVKHWRHF